MNVLSYIASVAIVVAYFVSVRQPRRSIWLHYANAIGGIPIMFVELQAGTYSILPLTLAFTALGWWGVVRDARIDLFKTDWSGPLTKDDA